jgi:serine/threonine-protein kinase
MLYEMVTGKLPFTGADKTEVIGAILKEAPVCVTNLRSDVPVIIEKIIDRCLEKDRAERYQNAAEIVADLQELRSNLETGSAEVRKVGGKKTDGLFAYRWPWVVVLTVISVIAAVMIYTNFSPFGRSTAPGRKMLVVLPFENLGPPEDEYFAAGVTEELMARLASIKELGVIARTSAMKYKDTEKTIEQIGEELRVEYVIEGTIRWQRMDGQKLVRVTPQLIRVSDEIHLWADVYEKAVKDIFQIQSEIAARVAQNLDITLLGSERKSVEIIHTENPDAYQAYLRGLEYRKRKTTAYGSRENALMEIEMFERAIELDPSFALAYADLCMSHYTFYYWYWDHTENRLSLMKDAAWQALELEPNLPESHLAIGTYYKAVMENDKALEEFGIARRLRPNDADVQEVIANALKHSGDFESSAETYEKAFELNPQNVDLLANIGWTYVFRRDYQKALKIFDRAISLAPDFFGGYNGKFYCYLYGTGENEKARTINEQMPGNSELMMSNLCLLNLYEREYRSALDCLDTMEDIHLEDPNDYYPTALTKAFIYEAMSQPDMAHAYYDSARLFLESRLEEKPYDDRIFIHLGLAYAGLGLKEEAIRLGELGVASIPISQNAILGPDYVYYLGCIYTSVGEHDAAIDQLEYLLSIPCYYTEYTIWMDPTFDPLRDHPRFRRLIREGAREL